jgi:hypothetical protein
VERRRIRGFAKRISLLVERRGRGRGGGNTDGIERGKNKKSKNVISSVGNP